MQLNEFSLFAQDVLRLSSKEDLSRLQAGELVNLQSYQDDLLLSQRDVRVVVDCADRGLVDQLLRRDQTRWLLRDNKTANQLILQYCAPVEVMAMELELGVDPLIAEALYDRQEIRDNSIEQACRWLAENFVVTGASEGDWLAVARFSNSATRGGFQLLGRGWRADVEERTDKVLLVRRVTRHVQRDSAFSLLTGQCRFVDASVTTQLGSATQQALLNAALRDSASYLELWNLYNDKQWQQELKKAEELKALRLEQCEGFEDGRDNAWRLIPRSQEQYREFRERWNALELPRDTQVDLSDTPPDWAEELVSEASADADSSTPRGTLRFESNHLVFKPASAGRRASVRGNESWLYLSMAGHRTMGKRRLEARQSIDSGQRLPQLKWLLEGVAVPAERRKSLKGMTSYARQTFHGGKPTPMQELAVERALNTPDIAVIIGPPGTGKTQVIAALQRQLAEEAEGRQIAGELLISSFQHDAVDNALERSDVFDLPGTRVGGKRGADDQQDLIEPWLQRKSAHLQQQIEQQLACFPELKDLGDLSSQLAMLRISRFRAGERLHELSRLQSAMRQLNDSYGIALSVQLEQQLEDYIAELQGQSAGRLGVSERSEALCRIRRLRTRSTAFADDGTEQAWNLLRWLQRQGVELDPEQRQLLESAADWVSPSAQQLADLESCKQKLLDRFLPDYRPVPAQQPLDSQGMRLLDRLENELDGWLSRRKQGVAAVLEQLQSSLQGNRDAARDAVSRYSMVLGATCQQAAGKQMASLKGLGGLKAMGVSFDTVVVDEAARANPLDLFIPMAMARRRIVLVGDDKQLPHMLEPDIEGQLQEEHQLTEQQLAAFRSSLFERMRLQLSELQARDSHIRVVMLDTQFRMHPLLGGLVSQQFYGGQLKSGRKSEDFAFSDDFLSAMQDRRAAYEDKVCSWIDVPDGKTQRRGKSLTREAEARRIAEEVHRLLQAGSEAMSVGVITFYAAQRELIMQELARLRLDDVPLMVAANGSYEPHKHFRLTRKRKPDGAIVQEERLRVGTVDGFQGKEFDVVLLSCVRTLPASSKPCPEGENPEQWQEKQLNHKFGFLRLPNRMNVAMSRQRQMLVCVGDKRLVESADAARGIPALQAFYELCKGEHGSVRQ